MRSPVASPAVPPAAAPLMVVAIATLLGASVAPVAAQPAGRLLEVPLAYPTLEAAIEAASPGDTISLDVGTYPGGVEVPENRPGITIRGVDRSLVVFDGENTRANAIEVEADGVTLENMSAHSFTANGFYWDGVDGFTGRYLTVWNVGLYGIYAIESRNGSMESSYVSGAGDAAFYIGECQPCDTIVHDVTAILSAVGFSGTNAGGNLVVENSIFDRNGTGILPNSFDVGLEPPPQRGARFQGNLVTGSGTVPVPRTTPLGGYTGIGIGIVGGSDNVVTENEVTGSARYGIVVVPAIDREATWLPSGNDVRSNTVAGSGIADLALAAGSAADNCFTGNDGDVTDPADLQAACDGSVEGSDAVAAVLGRPPPDLQAGLPPAPPYTEMEIPPAQPNMPAALAPAGDGRSALVLGIVALVALLGGAAMLRAGRPRPAAGTDPADPSQTPNPSSVNPDPDPDPEPEPDARLSLRKAGANLVVLGAIGLVLALLLALSSGAPS